VAAGGLGVTDLERHELAATRAPNRLPLSARETGCWTLSAAPGMAWPARPTNASTSGDLWRPTGTIA